MFNLGIPELVIICFVVFLIFFGKRLLSRPWVPPAAPRVETDDRLTRIEGRMSDLEQKLDAIHHTLATDAAASEPIPGDLRATLIEFVRQGRTIEAIKVLRENTRLGLKEAKDAVDAIAREAGVA